MSEKIRNIKYLVVNAIRQLKSAKGSTMKKIINLIAQQHNFSEPELKQAVRNTIKRAITCGIIQRSERGFVICDNTNTLKSKDPPLQLHSCIKCHHTTGYGQGRSGKRQGNRSGRSAKRRARSSRGMKKKSARSGKSSVNASRAKRRSTTVRKYARTSRVNKKAPVKEKTCESKSATKEEKTTLKQSTNQNKTRSTAQDPVTNENNQNE